MKFIFINIFINLLFIFQCYGKSFNSEFKVVKQTQTYFCPLLFKSEPFHLDQKWSVFKKQKQFIGIKIKKLRIFLQLILFLILKKLKN